MATLGRGFGLPQLRNGDPFERGALPDPDIVDLAAGDLLHIPRGWIHEAETLDGSSLHITLGFHPPMGCDLFRYSTDCANSSPTAVSPGRWRPWRTSTCGVAEAVAVAHSTTSTLVRREHLHNRLFSTEVGVGIQFAMSLIEGPAYFAPAMDVAAKASGPFRVGDLPGLDPAAQIDRVRTLLRDGLVELHRPISR